MEQLKKRFEIRVQVDRPILVGQDETAGRRQLIPITGGEVRGEGMNGTVLPGGVDSQVIRPDGRCELSARYGVRLDSGASFYIENNGIRTVPPECVPTVLSGGFVDPSLYYFRATPAFEVYHSSLRWMYDRVWVCKGTRLTEEVILEFFTVE